MDISQPGMRDIMAAVGLAQSGEREAARIELLRLWHRWTNEDAPLQQCAIAHFLADTEEEPAAELEWDLRALEAATGARGDTDCNALDASLSGFLPSLHLNVGDAYRRLNQAELARRHAEYGLARADVLGSDGYGELVRSGLERLLGRLEPSSHRPEHSASGSHGAA